MSSTFLTEQEFKQLRPGDLLTYWPKNGEGPTFIYHYLILSEIYTHTDNLRGFSFEAFNALNIERNFKTYFGFETNRYVLKAKVDSP